MMNQQIEYLISEYCTYAKEATTAKQDVDWNKLLDLLISKGEWTSYAAEQLISLVQDYGSFFLKNAYAFAIATNIEDGQIGL